MLFMFLVSIGISNLIIGLTVSKTEELFKKAGATERSLCTFFALTHLVSLFFPGTLRLKKTILQLVSLESILVRGLCRWVPMGLRKRLIRKVQLFPHLSGRQIVCVRPFSATSSFFSKAMVATAEYTSIGPEEDENKQHQVYFYDEVHRRRLAPVAGVKLPNWIVCLALDVVKKNNQEQT